MLEPDKAPATAMRLMEAHGVSIPVGVASYYTRLLALVRERAGPALQRGPTGTLYWNKPEEQRKVVRNGLKVFQDVGRPRRRGFVHYVSRSGEMIVTAGYNVAPIDVETVLIRHPAVAECACVPAPDPSGARVHVIKAYVVAKDGVVADAALKRALQGSRQGERAAVHVSARDRLRAGASQDAERQGPARRAAPPRR